MCRRSGAVFRHQRMIEFDRSCHAQPFHDPHRRDVAESRQSDDLRQADTGEAVLDRRSGGLGGITATPIITMQPPGDFDGRGERGLEFHPRQSDGTDERGHTSRFHSPLAVAGLGHMPYRLGNVVITLRSGQRTHQKPHHDRIGVLFRKQRQIAVPPRAQDQTSGFNHDCSAGCEQAKRYPVARAKSTPPAKRNPEVDGTARAVTLALRDINGGTQP